VRRALSGSTETGATTVHVAAPTVSVTPTVMLPTLDAPLEVIDVGRVNGAFAFRMIVRRDAGLITEVQATPTEFVPLGAFE